MEVLPAELLERVFRLLPPRVLRVVVLVCRRWRAVGEAPGLWLWVSLVVMEGNLAALPAMLDSRRLSRKTCLEARVVSEELLRAMARHPALRSVDMGHPSCALARQETGLLVAAVTRLETVDLRRAGMSAGQVAGLAGPSPRAAPSPASTSPALTCPP